METDNTFDSFVQKINLANQMTQEENNDILNDKQKEYDKLQVRGSYDIYLYM